MNEVVWSVVIMLSIGLVGTLWAIYYILRLAHLEIKDVSIQDQKNQKSH
jgi:hypothetical protein